MIPRLESFRCSSRMRTARMKSYFPADLTTDIPQFVSWSPDSKQIASVFSGPGDALSID